MNNVGEAQFRTVVKAMFNLAFLSSCVRICVMFSPAELALWDRRNRAKEPTGNYFRDLITLIIANLKNFDLIQSPPSQRSDKQSYDNGSLLSFLSLQFNFYKFLIFVSIFVAYNQHLATFFFDFFTEIV